MTPATVLLLAILAVLVLVGSRLGFGNRPLPAAVRPLVETGTVFILLGAVLGPAGLNLFTAELLSQFSPVLVIGLGWIGFLYGSHLEWRLLRRYPLPAYGMGLLQALVAFAVVAGVSWLVLRYWLAAALGWQEVLAAALILGICASGTAPAGVFQVTARWRIRAEDQNVLRFSAAVDDLPAIVLLGLMGAFLHPNLPGTMAATPWLWLALSLGIGVGLGCITHWLFPTQDDVRDNTLILLGTVSLGAGAATMLGLSPLFVTALAGTTFANLSPRKERAYGLLAEREHSLYAIFLLIAGLLFRVDWGPLLVLVPVYLLARLAGKLAGGLAGSQLFMARARISPLIGAGMLFQGGMTLAMAVSFQRTHLAALDHQVTTAIVVGVIVFELIGAPVAGRVLSRGRRP